MEPNYNKLCFFDTETVGLNPNYIVSLAYIAYENGEKIADGMIICNPDYPISKEASETNGFTNEMVKDYPLFPKQWKKISKYFDNAILIAHNSNFDVKALKEEAKRYNITLPCFWVCDTLANAKKLIPKGVTQNYRLGTLCDYFGITLKNWHTADADTRACLRLYNKLIEISDGNLIVK